MRSDRSTPERIERPAAAPVNAYGRLAEAVQAEGAAALVSLIETQGSSPREAGTAMVVRPSGGFHGTIGGGALEWRALADAREALQTLIDGADVLIQNLAPGAAARLGLSHEALKPKDANWPAELSSVAGDIAAANLDLLDLQKKEDDENN